MNAPIAQQSHSLSEPSRVPSCCRRQPAGRVEPRFDPPAMAEASHARRISRCHGYSREGAGGRKGGGGFLGEARTLIVTVPSIVLPRSLGVLTAVRSTKGVAVPTDHRHHEHSATNAVLAEKAPHTTYAVPIGAQCAAALQRQTGSGMRRQDADKQARNSLPQAGATRRHQGR